MALKDRYGRKIEYLRISVTDKCNFRCRYCMPHEGIELKPRDQILSFEEVTEIARVGASLGIWKVRLTGGEPLVRRDFEVLAAMLSETPGVKELSMTTNGSLLTPAMASALKEAGLDRVNISMDTLDPERFRKLTGGGELSEVLAGADAAAGAGLLPVKINMVITAGTTQEDVERMKKFCGENGFILQQIKEFSLYSRQQQLPFSFDRPQSCSLCNRIRLTADGYFKPCLFSNREIKVDMNDIEKSIMETVQKKPLRGTACRNRTMSQIGG
ncbi:MAG: radical SAM protein [Candidatus Krumholzibacteriales bacterium]